jgi:sulfite exporter TauE/SafE
VAVLWLGLVSLGLFGLGLLGLRDAWFLSAAAVGTITVLWGGILVHRSKAGPFAAANRAVLVGCALGLVPVSLVVWFVLFAVASIPS